MALNFPALNFPSNPTVGDTFLGGDTIWRWNGTAWDRVAYGTVTALGPLTDEQLRAAPVSVTSEQVGEVQADPAVYTVLGRLKTLATALAGVLQVSGSAAVGSAPSAPPLSVSGVDSEGLKRHLLTDPAGNQTTKPAGLTCLGDQFLTSLVSATALTVPTGATCAVIQAESQSVRWRASGANPTTSLGMLIPAGSEYFYTGPLNTFKAIEVTNGAKLNITYFR